MTLKTVLVTGANKGLGYATALALARRNYKVIMADKDDLTESRNKIIMDSCNENVCKKYLNLGSFSSVRSFAEELAANEERLDVLINNAGIYCMKHQRTCDGIDGVIQVNHLGPFLLTDLLTGLLKKSDSGRIIFVTSTEAFLHKLSLKTFRKPLIFLPDLVATAINYHNSKLCNMISSSGFAERLKKYNITCNCLHPGMANTDFMAKDSCGDGFIEQTAKELVRRIIKFTGKDVVRCAGLCTFLATSDLVKSTTGKFFVDYQVHRLPRVLEDKEFCRSIWKESEMLTGINCEGELAQTCDVNEKKYLT